MKKTLLLLLTAVLVCVALSGCGNNTQTIGDEPAMDANQETIDDNQVSVESDESLKEEGRDKETIQEKIVDPRVEEYLSKMTLDEKITQLFMMDFRTWGSEDNLEDVTALNEEIAGIIEKYKFGAIILFANNIKTTEDTVKLTCDIQAANAKGNEIPLIIASDQEGGMVYRLGSGTALPGNMALAATGNVSNALTAGRIIGSELQAVGINTDLAPVVDVNNNANNPVIGLRSFGDDATIVGEYGSAIVDGLNEYNIAGCAKHFPGHGDTEIDSHYGLPVVDKSYEELKDNELMPFSYLIKNGVDMIMTAHILYPQLDDSKVFSNKTSQEESRPATMSKVILTDILKGDMGFEGVVVTDGMNMQGVTDILDSSQAAVEAIAAGADILCMPTTSIHNVGDMARVDEIIASIKEAVDNGYISQERIDDAVRRILTLKSNRGILDYNPNDITVARALSVVGCDKNRELERDIAANAVTLIKNEDDFLPVKAGDGIKVLIACPFENEKAQCAIGWNRAAAAGKIDKSEEINVICYTKEDADNNQKLLKEVDNADVVIVISEVSGAQKMGYKEWNSKVVQDVISYAADEGKKTVVMSVDKPYDVQLYPNADAIIAVYGDKGSTIDVTEALIGSTVSSKQAFGPNIVAGIEVIFGVYSAQGKLPVDIPYFSAEDGKYTEKIVYERGYGLSYK